MSSEAFKEVKLQTDLYMRRDNNDYILFKEFDFMLEFKDISVIFPLEIFYLVRQLMCDFSFWCSENLKYLTAQRSYRERETLRLIMKFDHNNRLQDQSGRFFPGMSKIFSPAYELRSLNYQTQVKLSHMIRNHEDLLLLEDHISDMKIQNKGIKFQLHSFPIELIPDFNKKAGERSEMGYFIIVSRNERMSLPFLCAHSMITQGTLSGLKSPEIVSSVAWEEISKATNLNDAVKKLVDFLKDEYSVPKEKIIDILSDNKRADIIYVSYLSP